jgi:hypothetical protein
VPGLFGDFPELFRLEAVGGPAPDSNSASMSPSMTDQTATGQRAPARPPRLGEVLDVTMLHSLLIPLLTQVCVCRRVPVCVCA